MGEDDKKKNEGVVPKSFDDLIENTATDFKLKALARQKNRVDRFVVNFPALLETQMQPFVVNVIDISAFGAKIDKEIPIKFNSRAVLTLKTKPPIPLPCIPFEGEAESKKGSWNRMKFVTPIIDMQKVLDAINAAKPKS